MRCIAGRSFYLPVFLCDSFGQPPLEWQPASAVGQIARVTVCRVNPIRAKNNRIQMDAVRFVFALPIFPGSRPPSIVGANELNFCVRDGNRWTLITINTNSYGSLAASFMSKPRRALTSQILPHLPSLVKLFLKEW